MDQCKYCKEYHHEFQVCERYIEGVKKGEVDIAEEKIEELWLCGKAEEAEGSFQCLAYTQKPTHGAIKYLVNHVVSYKYFERMLRIGADLNAKAMKANVKLEACIIDLEADKTNLISQVARLKEEFEAYKSSGYQP